jgi:hypothetical protein
MYMYLGVTSELKTRALEHVESVEHQHDKFWNVKHREVIEHDDELQRLKHRLVLLYVKIAHLNRNHKIFKS